MTCTVVYLCGMKRQIIWRIFYLKSFSHFFRFCSSSWNRRSGGEHWQHIWSKHGMHLCHSSGLHKLFSPIAVYLFFLFHFSSLFFRTSPWPSTWGITGRTIGWLSPPAATKVEPSTHVSSRKFGFQMCSLCIQNVLLSMIQLWRTSCWGFFQMEIFSTVWGKKTCSHWALG